MTSSYQTDLNNLTFAGHVAIELDVLSDTKMARLERGKDARAEADACFC